MIKKANMIKRTYYLPKDLVERITERSNQMGLSSADIVRLAVKDYLKKSSKV